MYDTTETMTERLIRTIKGFCIVFLVLAAVLVQEGHSSGYEPVAGVVDLRSTFSDGFYDIQSLAQLARSKGIHVLFINDHDLMVMQYGLWPLRNLIRKREELNSILKMGADRYLYEIDRVGLANNDMIIIPGSETTPFYYWTGSPFLGGLTAHNHEKRILTVGMEKPADYENLPILHNHYSLRISSEVLPGVLFFAAALLAGLAMIFWRGPFRVAGGAAVVISAVLIADSNPFSKSPFDPYHGDRGIAPHQLLIDYVTARGGMTFWNYPETKSGIRPLGPIRVSTPPYPEALLESRGYTGFASLYGDSITVTEPEGIWDMVLKEYCRGLRERPPWGIATADFHREGESGEMLGNYQTVFFVKEKKKSDILDAMRNGRMYAVQGRFPQVPTLRDFSVSSPDGAVKAISGQEAALNGYPRISLSLSAVEPASALVTVRVIRSGSLVHRVEGTLPMRLEFDDAYYKPGERIYYRMDMRGAGTIVSNPIFVSFIK